MQTQGRVAGGDREKRERAGIGLNGGGRTRRRGWMVRQRHNIVHGGLAASPSRLRELLRLLLLHDSSGYLGDNEGRIRVCRGRGGVGEERRQGWRWRRKEAGVDRGELHLPVTFAMTTARGSLPSSRWERGAPRCPLWWVLVGGEWCGKGVGERGGFYRRGRAPGEVWALALPKGWARASVSEVGSR
jgi:hypothetical protein